MVTALLVTSAATLFESAPFILAAAVLTRMPRWDARFEAYLGCGCGVGPSARSLPAAAAACLVFGPLVAGARLVAALIVERFAGRSHRCAVHRTTLLSELLLLLPVAAAGGCAALLVPAVAGAHADPAVAFIAGAATAFAMAPCALGGVAFAATLRSILPAAAAGFLCISGIVDLRAWLPRRAEEHLHDSCAYALLALACAIVAVHGGGGILHPVLAFALWPCALAAAYCAYRFRGQSCARLRIAPALMLIGGIVAAPPPAYHATETTLGDAFAGERLDFTGVLTRTGNAATLVRYAITCCRADAAPIVVRLLAAPPVSLHGWVHASGVLVQSGNDLRLRTQRLAAITPPVDPFVYR